MVKVDLFKNIEIFSDLTVPELEQIADLAVEVSYDDDIKLISEGDPADAFFVIINGKIMVSKTASDGTKRFIGHLSSGDIFGEIAILDSFSRSATVSTVGTVTVLKIEKELFLKYIEDNLLIGNKILSALGRNISKQMRILTKAYIDLAEQAIIPWSF